jgi:hypothetical protein
MVLHWPKLEKFVSQEYLTDKKNVKLGKTQAANNPFALNMLIGTALV